MEQSELHEGTVVRRGDKPDFGFIKCADVGKVFLHRTAFKVRPSVIHKGMVVRFRVVQVAGEPNPRAVDAELIS